MSSLNKVVLIGNAGDNPEIRTTSDGKKVATLSLATSEQWKDKTTGAKTKKTEWHKIVVFNEALANIVQKYAKKGSKLYLEGNLHTRKWQDKNGKDRYTTEVVLSNNGQLLLLDAGSDSGEEQGENREMDDIVYMQ